MPKTHGEAKLNSPMQSAPDGQYASGGEVNKNKPPFDKPLDQSPQVGPLKFFEGLSGTPAAIDTPMQEAEVKRLKKI